MEAVKDECKKRHEEMTEMVKEMERKAEGKTKELGTRVEKHESKTEAQFKTTKEEISGTNKEVAQVKRGARKAIVRDARGRIK